MADYELTIDGAQQEIARLNRWDLGAALHPVVMQHLGMWRAALATYPAPPPSSTYRRTGTLGRLWVQEGSGSSLQWKLGNATPYARLVEDRDEQADVHKRTGWPTWQDQIEKHEEPLAKDATAALVRLIS